MLQIAICDDEEKILFKLEETTGIFFKTHCVDCKIQTYPSSENLRYDLQDGIYYDLFLLDIEMPQVSGMDLAEKIRDAFPAAKIIFITSHLEYAITAYEFSVFRYIPKTQLEEKLPLALRDFYKLYCLERDEYYTIEVKNHVERLPYREILYILKDGKYAVFHLQNGTVNSVRKTLSQVFGEIGINCSDGSVKTVLFYEKNGKEYIEQTYQGIYMPSSELGEKITELLESLDS